MFNSDYFLFIIIIIIKFGITKCYNIHLLPAILDLERRDLGLVVTFWNFFMKIVVVRVILVVEDEDSSIFWFFTFFIYLFIYLIS